MEPHSKQALREPEFWFWRLKLHEISAPIVATVVVSSGSPTATTVALLAAIVSGVAPSLSLLPHLHELHHVLLQCLNLGLGEWARGCRQELAHFSCKFKVPDV